VSPKPKIKKVHKRELNALLQAGAGSPGRAWVPALEKRRSGRVEELHVPEVDKPAKRQKLAQKGGTTGVSRGRGRPPNSTKAKAASDGKPAGGTGRGRGRPKGSGRKASFANQHAVSQPPELQMLHDMSGMDDGSVSYRPRPIDIDKQLVVLMPGDTPLSIGDRWPSSAGSPMRINMPEWLTPTKSSAHEKYKKKTIQEKTAGGSSYSILIPDDQLGTPKFGDTRDVEESDAKEFKRGKKYISCESAVRGRCRILVPFVVSCH
jgi:hypothetical protein